MLSMSDRNMSVGAALAYCQKEGHKKIKDHRKLEQLKRLVGFEETLDYFAMINDALDEEQAKWEGAWNRYRVWRQYKESSVTLADLRKDYPHMDLSGEGPPKPPVRQPVQSQEDKRGPERPFYLPAKLDAWIEEALQTMDWATIMTEGAVEICEKYGIGKEEV
jgi:hypothetical protein